VVDPGGGPVRPADGLSREGVRDRQPGRPIVVIKTGGTYADLVGRVGDYENWIVSGLGVHPSDVVVMDVEADPALPDPSGLSGIVITGSHAMVTDGHSWIEPLAEWLRSLVRAEVPILGVCYGHQLLAHAAGGRVGFLPAGPEIGTVKVELLPQAEGDHLFLHMPSRFLAHTTHAQGVLELPDQAVLLARTEQEPHAAFRVGPRAWGVQFHPEYNEVIMLRYVREQRQTLEELGKDPGRVEREVRTAGAGPILRRFAELTREPRQDSLGQPDPAGVTR